MAKHRKTRQQKMVADQRHVVYHLETNSAQDNSPVEKKLSSSTTYKLDNTVIKPHVTSYAYVKADLTKTLLVTSVIIFAQISLFIFLNRV